MLYITDNFFIKINVTNKTNKRNKMKIEIVSFFFENVVCGLVVYFYIEIDVFTLERNVDLFLCL